MCKQICNNNRLGSLHASKSVEFSRSRNCNLQKLPPQSQWQTSELSRLSRRCNPQKRAWKSISWCSALSLSSRKCKTKKRRSRCHSPSLEFPHSKEVHLANATSSIYPYPSSNAPSSMYYHGILHLCIPWGLKPSLSSRNGNLQRRRS